MGSTGIGTGQDTGTPGPDTGTPGPDGERPGPERAGPMVARLLLGGRLRHLRERSLVSRRDAGEAIRASESKISRLELGRSGFKRRDVDDLLTLYGLDDGAERSTLLALAGHANVPGWWQEYEDVVPAWFEDYLGLEQAASIIRGYEVLYLPGLLQTPAYAHALLAAGANGATRLETMRRAQLRMRRQQVIYRRGPARLWVVIDEAALHRSVGGTAVMRAQLRHLVNVARLPHVRIQVLPFRDGAYTGGGIPLTMLRFAEAELPDVVYLENHTGAEYPSRPVDLVQYWAILNHLAEQALTPADTIAMLQRILAET
ncbi:MAG TPA: helix-turn-helix transcriptional regulator [Streptosporangiaceae bacterium]|nr:helix-turn-helix transcriptional regulator [Streptosporangiaceae bacterium]